MDTTKSIRVSTSSTDTTRCRRTKVRMVQNVFLIWLDKNIDNNSEDHQDTMMQLRRIINRIEIFTNAAECINFLENVFDEKVIMIISDALCQEVIPLIHDIAQVHAIFVFCSNEKQHEQSVKEWPKIKGVSAEIKVICEVIKEAAQQCEQNATSFSLVSTNSDISNKKLDQLDCSFMYTQILKEILLTITFGQQHIKELIDYCHEQFVNNDYEFKKMKEFEQKYRDKTPIWWYTYEGFLYPMLNRALRLMDVDTIIKMGFFIDDLHRHIKKLYSEQFNRGYISETITLYRGQGLSETDLDRIKNSRGGLMSFNNFLSTSKDRDVSFAFAESNARNPDLVGILFIITIGRLVSSMPFAFIKNDSYYQDENEILFSMHTIFRICDIKPMRGKNRLYQADLTLTSDNDQDLHLLTDRIREETFPNSIGWDRLGELLLKLGKYEKAQQVYEVLLDQPKNEIDKAHIYVQLGRAKNNQGKYDEAITFYEKSIKIYEKTHLMNRLDLGISYSNIGGVYYNIGEYLKALESDKKALEIRQQSLPPNHPDVAQSYNNIGVVYYNMGDYSKALSSHEKALVIKQQSPPPNHPTLSMSYNNIGLVHKNMGEYSKALSYYEKALKIRQQSLPPNHPDLAWTYGNTGNVYNKMGDHPKALSFHEKALEIRQQLLSENHPDFAHSYKNIAAVYENMGDYSKALLFYERAVDIGQRSLPSNNHHLEKWRKSLDRVKQKMKK